MHDFCVPFDDNLTQRESGIMKLPYKISGQASCVFLAIILSPCKSKGSIRLSGLPHVFLCSPLLRRS
jgi:hypothetical protein